MLQEVIDLRKEGDVVFELLSGMGDDIWEKKTQFKDWTVHDVILHLHFSDYLALTTAKDTDSFLELVAELMVAMQQGNGLMQYSRDWIGEISGPDLLQLWRKSFLEMCDLFGSLEPKTRLEWFGPSMGVRMFATARLMETWAHAQELYDLFGVHRQNTNRIKHICVIGVKTFGWTFINRSLTPPTSMPYLRLEAPEGDIWEWGEMDEENKITGKAEEFAQVVTQVRNIADTSLVLVGKTANDWMNIAQCFAGPPVVPPAPGTRFPQT